MPVGILDQVGVLGGLQREPTESELAWFKANAHVPGMMTKDMRVIMNPFSSLNADQKKSVGYNEAARLMMMQNPAPFGMTPQQHSMFKNYGDPQNQRDTIAARIFSNDSSSGEPTGEQSSWVNRNLGGGQYGPAQRDPLFMRQIQNHLMGIR